MKHTVKGRHATSNDELVAYLKNTVETGSSLLDLGCGPKLYSNPLLEQCSRIVTVDAWPWVEPDIVADLENTPLTDVVNERFDYILMLDFIEHLDKAAGVGLIEACKTLCNKRIILLTPLEEIWNDNHENVQNKKLWCYGNNYDLHKSMWHPDDFSGWHTIDLKSDELLDNYYIGYYEA
jgi:2-polyprenyl-3-methyl-5-hydroxy-6-metoxy-1,4-benzoquinol methylase